MATDEPLEGHEHPSWGFAGRSVHDKNRDGAVVVLGEINPDIVVTGVPPLSFRQREDVTGPTSMTVGSSVAILASGLARLGTATSIVGVVGDDPFADFMLRRLKQRGVDVSLVRTVRGGRTGSSVILVRRDDANDRQILTDLGVMPELLASDLPLSALEGARHLHIGSWFLHSGAVQGLPDLLDRARALGLSTSLDPNDDPAQRWDSHLERALPHAETLFCNEAEALGIAAAAGWNGSGSIHGAARYLLERLAPGGTVVLKRGPAGAFAHTADGTLHVAAPPTEVVDTVGAGDSLAAGFLHGRLHGGALDEALLLAVASGTLSTRCSGGVDGQPTPDEAHQLAEQLTCSIPYDRRRAGARLVVQPPKEPRVTSIQNKPTAAAAAAPDHLRDIVRRHKGGAHVGITSVCSAHPLVLQAAVEHAHESGDVVLIEATSNQVDQTGGYTGMRPTDFRGLVLGLAERTGLPPENVILGGDHLGPNRWRHLPPDEAMQFADELVAAYVTAGFTKIHLDCSFSCAGDPQPLTDELVAQRSARLIATAERCAEQGAERLTYVIGTEVPVPGGAHETLEGVPPTSAQAARTTLQTHRDAFEAAGVAHVWPRVAALVVQPGVEFDHQQVFAYRSDAARELSAVLDDEGSMVFEAHSTDYQTQDALSALVRDHWAVLKVGPQLTFALREAFFGLAAIEEELVPPGERSRLKEVLEERMLAQPEQWAGYYTGTAVEQRVNRRYSYSDRLRYYWPDPLVHEAQERLIANLSAVTIPLPLLSQYLPAQYERVRDGRLDAAPEPLVVDQVKQVLRTYARACSGALTQETRSS